MKPAIPREVRLVPRDRQCAYAHGNAESTFSDIEEDDPDSGHRGWVWIAYPYFRVWLLEDGVYYGLYEDVCGALSKGANILIDAKAVRVQAPMRCDSPDALNARLGVLQQWRSEDRKTVLKMQLRWEWRLQGRPIFRAKGEERRRLEAGAAAGAAAGTTRAPGT